MSPFSVNNKYLLDKILPMNLQRTSDTNVFLMEKEYFGAIQL